MSKTRVLFVCTQNSARSQMAEGLLRAMAGDRFEALSGGVRPTVVHPLAIQAMREIGIDISTQRSKSLEEFLGGPPVDVVITVCDAAAADCPVFPGTSERLHWSIPDPAPCGGAYQEWLDCFRRARDDLWDRIREFSVEGVPRRRETAESV